MSVPRTIKEKLTSQPIAIKNTLMGKRNSKMITLEKVENSRGSRASSRASNMSRGTVENLKIPKKKAGSTVYKQM